MLAGQEYLPSRVPGWPNDKGSTVVQCSFSSKMDQLCFRHSSCCLQFWMTKTVWMAKKNHGISSRLWTPFQSSTPSGVVSVVSVVACLGVMRTDQYKQTKRPMPHSEHISQVEVK